MVPSAMSSVVPKTEGKYRGLLPTTYPTVLLYDDLCLLHAE
jgi:hypothetical protein